MLNLLLLAAFLFFAYRRVPRYLHMFQQEEYDGKRFINWLVATGAIDRKLTAALLISGMLMYFWGPDYLMPLVFTALFIGFSFFESDPRKEAKKKLVMTSRAKRIFWATFGLLTAAGLLAAFSKIYVSWILAVQIIPFLLVAANALLAPLEANIKNGIMDEAKSRLAQVAPKVTGITGSFGKTSVKHILGHILEMDAPTLYTPGSINTLMGISRIIRENLRDDCQYFIVEMGAYGIQSIEKLCNLTPPQTGVITALGAAHYERFKTLDMVARAKFELAEAVLKNPEGRMVIHESVLDQPYAREFVMAQRGRFVVCGSGADANVRIGTVTQTSQGLTLEVRVLGQEYILVAPLFGLHHAGNIALAFATALELGVRPDRAVAALRTVPQIQHRLEVKTQPDGTIYIDDAFNSNPLGFRAAVELMATLAREKGGRRILMTPGVAELGLKHDEAHRELGEHAAGLTDIVLAVKPERIPTFVSGYESAQTKGKLLPMANLAAAQEWLRQNGQAGDIVLVENDLPDIYEKKLVL